MRLTRHTDFALRIMIRLAATPDARVAIRVLAADCDAPENHVMKITPTLARAGLVRSVRGRIGGLILARPPEEIALGDIVRVTEPGFAQHTNTDDRESPVTKLSDVIEAAATAYILALNQYRLSDMLHTPQAHMTRREREGLPILPPVS